MAHRGQVLSLYRRILQTARGWQATDPAHTQTERDYIRTEAHRLFNQNKDVKDETEIKQHVREAEARLEIALHYNIPYPRHVNIPTYVLPPSKRRLKGRERALNQAKPIYYKSYQPYDTKDS